MAAGLWFPLRELSTTKLLGPVYQSPTVLRKGRLAKLVDAANLKSAALNGAQVRPLHRPPTSISRRNDMATNASGRFSADVGYTKRPKHPKRPRAGEPAKTTRVPVKPTRKKK